MKNALYWLVIQVLSVYAARILRETHGDVRPDASLTKAHIYDVGDSYPEAKWQTSISSSTSPS